MVVQNQSSVTYSWEALGLKEPTKKIQICCGFLPKEEGGGDKVIQCFGALFCIKIFGIWGMKGGLTNSNNKMALFAQVLGELGRIKKLFFKRAQNNKKNIKKKFLGQRMGQNCVDTPRFNLHFQSIL